MPTHKSTVNIKAIWDRCHNVNNETNNNVPAFLYTDENPATTIKGTGYKNKATAERTIRLTSQPGALYKQYWTIRAIRERAAHHSHSTAHMKEAIHVFDEWLKHYQVPTMEERKKQKEEWNNVFKSLCNSKANLHSYGKRPSREDLIRARSDTEVGIDILVMLLSSCRRSKSNKTCQDYSMDNTKFPITAWSALFGAPACIHGYGKHDIQSNISKIYIDGSSGLEEITGASKASSALGLAAFHSLKRIYIQYDRDGEIVTETEVEHYQPSNTLATLWGGKQSYTLESEKILSYNKTVGNVQDETKRNDNYSTKALLEPFWNCHVCTFAHKGKFKRYFLSCEICGTNRKGKVNDDCVLITPETTKLIDSSPPSHVTKRKVDRISTTHTSFLRAPTSKDIQPRNRQKGLDASPPTMDYIIVLDFEWTADDKHKIEPVAEITQFPSVCMKIQDRQVLANNFHSSDKPSSKTYENLPHDLRLLSPTKRHDAVCVSMFDSFVRPTLNPTLTKFSIDLTAITQGMVNVAPSIDITLDRYLNWLRSIGLVDIKGNRIGNWAFATWGDCDIMTTLRLELEYKSIELPQCFYRWINLKDDSIFKRHYRVKPRGGLRACVESVGEKWEGRAHNGLIDSINTAKIVRNMVQSGFRFTRTTRGLDNNGIPFGKYNTR